MGSSRDSGSSEVGNAAPFTSGTTATTTTARSSTTTTATTTTTADHGDDIGNEPVIVSSKERDDAQDVLDTAGVQIYTTLADEDGNLGRPTEAGGDGLPALAVRDFQQGHSSLSTATFNFTNSIIGAGIIGLPFALREAGFFFGIFLLFFVAWVTDYSIRLIITAGRITACDSYEELCEAAFGMVGKVIIALSMFSFAFGAMCAYVVIIGDTIPAVLAQWADPDHSTLLTNRSFIISIVSAVVLFPISSYRDVSKLAKTSFISVMFVTFIVLTIFIKSMQQVGSVDSEEAGGFTFISKNFLGGVSVMALAYVCHHNTFLLYASLKDNSMRRWSIVTHYSIGIATLASIVLSASGFAAFRDQTEGNILNNFPEHDTVINLARFSLALTMFFTYPLELFVCRDTLHRALTTPDSPERARWPPLYHIGVTVLLCCASLGIGLLTSNLGIVLELTGGFSAVILGFIMPGAVYAKVAGGKIVSKKKLPAVVLAVAGVIICISSTSLTIKKIATGEE